MVETWEEMMSAKLEGWARKSGSGGVDVILLKSTSTNDDRGLA
jgi:hypothetical protein